jgi:hypothetical protein
MEHNVSTTHALSLSLPDISPSRNSFTVSGDAVSMVAPDYLTYNMTQIALLIILGVAAIYLARKKGVF